MLFPILITLLVAQASFTHAFSPASVRVNSVQRRASHPNEVQFIDSTQPLTFSWLVNVNDEATQTYVPRAVKQTSYTLSLRQLTPSSSSSTALKWTSGFVTSSSHTHVRYQGPSLHPDTTFQWSIEYCVNIKNNACSEPATGLIHTTIQEWQNASFIGHSLLPLTQYRRSFELPSSSSTSLHEASLYVATLGLTEIEINGIKVDATRKLDPVWTTYEIRSFYSAFDVTSLLSQSTSSPSTTNVIGVWVGSGWFSQEQYVHVTIPQPTYINPRFQLVLSIVFADGSKMSVVSEGESGDWQGRMGPILHDSIYNGEHFDSRLHNVDWASPSFKDPFPNLWLPAQTLGPLSSTPQLSLLPTAPIRASDDGIVVKPVNLFSPVSNNTYVFDMGQNFAGWARIKLRGPRSVQITIRYAEVLEHVVPNSIYSTFIYTDNLRAAAATDTYILSGSSPYDLYEPRFTYHGFRYVQLMGVDVPPTLDDAEGIIVRSWNVQTSKLTFNQTVLNQIQHAVVWATQSNMMGVMSDCPQRDERKGWMGDVGLTVDEGMYNFDSNTFYQSFARQILDVQKSDGELPDTVPFSFGNFPADPNWGHAYPVIVFTHYSHFGDFSFVHLHYEGVRAWVEYMVSRYKSDGGLKNLYVTYGDWVPPPPQTQTNQHLISSYAFLSDVQIVISLATIVNNTADVAAFSSLYQTLATEFHSSFFDTTRSVYADGKQTAQVLALALPHVVPDNLRKSVASALVSDVKANSNHFTTGIVGVKELFPVLANADYGDVVLDLLLQTSYPSYGYMFNNPYENATTFWELLDTPMETAGMNSRNHHMFASVGTFLHRLMAGIQINHFATLSSSSSSPVCIAPMWIDARVNNVRDEVTTLYGTYTVEWRRVENQDSNGDVGFVTTILYVSIPSNANAQLVLASPTPSHTLRCQRLAVADVNVDDDGNVMTKANRFDEAVVLERRDNVLVSAHSPSVIVDSTTGIEEIKHDDDRRLILIIGAGVYQFTAEWA